jgi:hypothetical protein
VAGGIGDVGKNIGQARRILSHREVQGDETKGQGQERVAGEDRHRLSEHLVVGGDAAAEVVVVHGGQIVVDERVRVDQLHRARGRHHVVHVAADRFRSGDHEDRPQPLTAREHAVAHGAVQSLGRLGFGR